MKSILLMTFMMAAALSTAGQTAAAPGTQCTLKVAPVIRGVRLGMTTEEVLTMFPGSRDQENIKAALTPNTSFPRYGVTNFSLFPGEYAGKERFAGVSSIGFIFVDAHLVRYAVHYARPPWPHVEDFINTLAAALKLPSADSWTKEPDYRKLDCDGFRVSASVNVNSPGATVTVASTDDPYKVQTERRTAAEDEERRAFKP